KEFISATVVVEVAKQSRPLGGFHIPSRDEENQLTTNFPEDAVAMDDSSNILVEHLGRGLPPLLDKAGDGDVDGDRGGIGPGMLSTVNLGMGFTVGVNTSPVEAGASSMSGAAGAALFGSSSSGRGISSMMGMGDGADG
ncbi:unnamed protein product, partial [Discosporangium mesarthrocarpum]